jgi:hypothetical protein
MAYTAYTLPNIANLAAGTIKTYLYVNDSLPALTIPSNVKITKFGNITERLDVNPAVLDIENVEIEATEDYATYEEGFWFKVIMGYPTLDVEMMFLLNSGTGEDQYLFRGKILRDDIVWTEHYVSGSSRVRTVKIRLLTGYNILSSITIPDLITEAKLHLNYLTSSEAFGNMKTISLGQLLASAVKLAFGTTYDATDIQERGYDIRLSYLGGARYYYSPMQIMLPVQKETVYGNNTWVDYVMFDSTNADYLGQIFGNALELLRAFSTIFCFVPRYYFGDTNGSYSGSATARHRIELLTRGRIAGTVTPDGGLIESSMRSSDPATSFQNSFYFSNAVGNESNWWDGAASHYGAVPQWLNPAISFSCPWYIGQDQGTYDGLWFIVDDGAGAWVYLSDAEWYDYATDGWILTDWNATTDGNKYNWLCYAASEYYAHRYPTGKIIFDREYGRLTATTDSAGPEMVSNGGFDTDLTGWTATTGGGSSVARSTAQSNTAPASCKFIETGGGPCRMYGTVNLITGVTYVFTWYDLTTAGTSQNRLDIYRILQTPDTTYYAADGAWSERVYEFTPVVSGQYLIEFYCGTDNTLYIDDISVKTKTGYSMARNLVVLSRSTFSDGSTSRTFYAQEVEKRIQQNCARVLWKEE